MYTLLCDSCKVYDFAEPWDLGATCPNCGKPADLYDDDDRTYDKSQVLADYEPKEFAGKESPTPEPNPWVIKACERYARSGFSGVIDFQAVLATAREIREEASCEAQPSRTEDNELLAWVDSLA